VTLAVSDQYNIDGQNGTSYTIDQNNSKKK